MHEATHHFDFVDTTRRTQVLGCQERRSMYDLELGFGRAGTRKTLELAWIPCI